MCSLSGQEILNHHYFVPYCALLVCFAPFLLKYAFYFFFRKFLSSVATKQTNSTLKVYRCTLGTLSHRTLPAAEDMSHPRFCL